MGERPHPGAPIAEVERDKCDGNEKIMPAAYKEKLIKNKRWEQEVRWLKKIETEKDVTTRTMVAMCPPNLSAAVHARYVPVPSWGGAAVDDMVMVDSVDSSMVVEVATIVVVSSKKSKKEIVSAARERFFVRKVENADVLKL